MGKGGWRKQGKRLSGQAPAGWNAKSAADGYRRGPQVGRVVTDLSASMPLAGKKKTLCHRRPLRRTKNVVPGNIHHVAVSSFHSGWKDKGTKNTLAGKPGLKKIHSFLASGRGQPSCRPVLKSGKPAGPSVRTGIRDRSHAGRLIAPTLK